MTHEEIYKCLKLVESGNGDSLSDYSLSLLSGIINNEEGNRYMLISVMEKTLDRPYDVIQLDIGGRVFIAEYEKGKL
jgi:hypothetical protein